MVFGIEGVDRRDREAGGVSKLGASGADGRLVGHNDVRPRFRFSDSACHLLLTIDRTEPMVR